VNRTYLSYEQATPHIKEGFVLLFRGQGIISKFIQSITNSEYSHAALASWTNGDSDPILEVLEFREFLGSRAINLQVYLGQLPKGTIDVFSPAYTSYTKAYKPELGQIVDEIKYFNGRAITRSFRKHLGQPYSYWQIANIFWYRIPLIRFFVDKSIYQDENGEFNYSICSSSIASVFSQHYTDLVRFKANAYTTPSDLSQSPLLSYLFTLTV